MIHALRLLLVSLVALFSACAAPPPQRGPLDFQGGTVRSADGVAIHYVEGGRGDTALVFVHGWTGDVSVWDSAMKRFAPRYRVVALDLAGHGSSGRERQDWTVDNFARDVAAVVRGLDLHHCVLIGHSMSGPITVAAANQFPDRVVGLVPVDTLLDAEWKLPPEVAKPFFEGLHTDFPGTVEGFFRGVLFAKTSPKEVADRIVNHARAADPKTSAAMLERAGEYELQSGLRALHAPIHAINSDLNPTKLETNRKYAPRFDAEIITGVGHWPHLEAPERFNEALEKALAAIGK